MHSTRCPTCDNGIETLEHVLLTCNFAKDILERIRLWWNLDQLYLSNCSDLEKGSNPMFKTSTGSSIWQATIWVSSYLIWKNRNDFTFGNSKVCPLKIVSDIQAKSFEWINCRAKQVKLDWLNWINNPRFFDVNPVAKKGIG
ncbi:uncharacterized protein [Rutidosis leptorrhynchoides]|uniref:uncharacterized protein n=1 Tax=Rutidosis leptorrhynchoides TaxID=125765 RepID=UPI003A992458